MTEQQGPEMEWARKRARQVQGFHMHLMTYVAVCALLVVIDLVTGSAGDTFIGLDWAYWQIIGWGIGVFMHAISIALPLGSWEQRKAEELYEKSANANPSLARSKRSLPKAVRRPGRRRAPKSGKDTTW
jgi:hypothetical protein